MKLVMCKAAVVAACSLAIVKPALADSALPSPEELASPDTEELATPATGEEASPDTEDSTAVAAEEATFDEVGEATESELTRAPNSVYAEGLGSGIVYSVNYERLIAEDVGARVGFGYTSISASAGSASASTSAIAIPVTVSYLGIGGQHHMLEIGGGLTVFHTSGSASSLGVSSSGAATTAFPELLVGYRLHPVAGAGFQLRVGAMAFAGKGLGITRPDPTKVGVLPWFYLSLGASF